MGSGDQIIPDLFYEDVLGVSEPLLSLFIALRWKGILNP